jgi:hypothetical protein
VLRTAQECSARHQQQPRCKYNQSSECFRRTLLHVRPDVRLKQRAQVRQVAIEPVRVLHRQALELRAHARDRRVGRRARLSRRAQAPEAAGDALGLPIDAVHRCVAEQRLLLVDLQSVAALLEYGYHVRSRLSKQRSCCCPSGALSTAPCLPPVLHVLCY